MKKIVFTALIFIALSANSCTKLLLGDEPMSQPEAVFENFWQQMNDKYSGLTVRPVNWDSLYKVYRPQVTAQTTDSRLIEIFKTMLLPSDDNHLGFKAGSTWYYPSSSNNIPNYLGRDVVEKGLKKTLKNYQNLFFYTKTDDNIGYLFISTFDSGKFNQANFEYIDTILEELKDTKGIVVDMRLNGGGNENFAKIVASRFANSTRLYKYTRVKTGRNHDDYSDFIASTFQPQGNFQYTKPVTVLTNQYVFSTAINFVLMMRVQPHVTTVGTITGNGVNGGETYELPNGWLLRAPLWLAYTPEKMVVEGEGIKPKVTATITEEIGRAHV